MFEALEQVDIHGSCRNKLSPRLLMIKIGFILLGFAAFIAANNVTLSGDKWEWVIQNWSGFNYWRRNATWTINTDSNSTIDLLCPELKLGTRSWNFEENCNYANLVFSDGVQNVKYCYPDTNVLIKGQTSQMVVKFHVAPNSGSLFYCKAKSVPRPRS